MADAARREARKRRILENSKYRLQRISGRTIDPKTSDHENVSVSKQLPHSVLSNQNSHGMYPRDPLINSQWDEDPLDLGEQIESSLLNSEHENLHTLPNRLNFMNGNILTQRHRDSSTESHDNVENTFYSTDEPSQGLKKSEKNVRPMISSFLNSPLVYVALAVHVNLIMILKLESIFGTSIIIPFFVLFFTRVYLCDSISDSPKGNLLFAALVLCNIRPNLLYTLQKTLSIFNLIIRDLSLFIFTFVIIYCKITRYFIDMDIYPPEKIEVIVDNSRAAST